VDVLDLEAVGVPQAAVALGDADDAAAVLVL
jgi:hypothetical protein